MWMVYVATALVIGIAVFIGLKQRKVLKGLKAEGKIVDRSLNFAEKGEEFTAKIGSYTALKEQLLKLVKICAMEGNTSSVVKFQSKCYAARLLRVDFDEPSGIGIFRFEFTRWKEGDYTYVDNTEMNMLMTAVEKAFLNLDPNTGVKKYNLSTKTKHSL